MSRHKRRVGLRAGPAQLSLRWRLTIWYLLTLGLILLLFAAFLYWQLRANLFDQLDASLQLMAARTGVGLNNDGSRLVFLRDQAPDAAAGGAGDLFGLYLTAADGTVWDRSDRAANLPLPENPRPGLATQLVGDDAWRVFSQPLTVAEVDGWLHVVADLDPVSDTLDRLLALMLIGGPLALALAGLGGLFLASRALRPIDRVTQTAQAISASDLNRRIRYQGPADEVGRLAETFDTMLNRLQTAFERERRFTGDAAHELRTPLTALKGRIDVALSQSRQPRDYVVTLQEMQDQVDRLIRLSGDLLFMARLDQGRMARQSEPIDLPALLEAVVDQLRPLAAAKSIALVAAMPEELTIHGDMDWLIRLFINLLDNAVKYTPEDGRISLDATLEESAAVIAITDTGPGIPAEHLPHLFERFYRVEGDRARTRRGNTHGGAGLGLAIAHEIVRAHGGTLAVQSAPGSGATFIVRLPQSEPTRLTT